MSAPALSVDGDSEKNHNLQIFEIDELRKRIFADLDKATLAKCAQVCSLWADDPLNLLWIQLDSVLPLLSTICTLIKDGKAFRFSEKRISLAQWKRLQFYGAKVHVLKIAASDTISSDIVNLVYRHRLDICLTPNLSTLTIRGTCQIDLAEVFMNPELISLTFNVPPEPLHCETMFDNIKYKLRSLAFIAIGAQTESLAAAESIEKGINSISHHLPKLRTIGLPYLTTSLITSLSEMTNLTSITWQNYAQRVSLGKDFQVAVNAKFAFARLISLEQTGRFQDMIHLLNHVRMLKRLRVTAWMNEPTGMYRALLIFLSKTHPKLTKLYVDNIPHSWTFQDEEASGEGGIMFGESILCTIQTFTHLTILRLTMASPLRFTSRNVIDLLSVLPDLQVLYLNCSHVILRDDGPSTFPARSALSIQILSDFARWCPKLTDLGLFVDCRNLPLLTDKPEHTLKLSRLNLGVSHIGPYNLHLAHYLTYHCLPLCDFASGDTLWQKAIKDRVIAHYGSDYAASRWDGERENIKNMFRVFSKLQEKC